MEGSDDTHGTIVGSINNGSSADTAGANEIPAGMGRRTDGSLVPIADCVQSPSDIASQYGGDRIPGQFPEVVERNLVAGLDERGYPIPGATLTPAALDVWNTYQQQQELQKHAAAHGDDAPPSAPSAPVGAHEPYAIGGAEPSHVAVPVAHLSRWQEFVSVLQRGGTLATHELSEFVQSIEHAFNTTIGSGE